MTPVRTWNASSIWLQSPVWSYVRIPNLAISKRNPFTMRWLFSLLCTTYSTVQRFGKLTNLRLIIQMGNFSIIASNYSAISRLSRTICQSNKRIKVGRLEVAQNFGRETKACNANWDQAGRLHYLYIHKRKMKAFHHIN